MLYAMLVTATLGSFALTGFLAYVFKIRSFWVLVAIVAAFAFAIPSGIGVYLGSEWTPTWQVLLTAAGLSLLLVGGIITARYVYRFSSSGDRGPRQSPHS